MTPKKDKTKTNITEGGKTDSLRRKIKKLKGKQKMQKTTEDEENIFLSGFPPEFRE